MEGVEKVEIRPNYFSWPKITRKRKKERKWNAFVFHYKRENAYFKSLIAKEKEPGKVKKEGSNWEIGPGPHFREAGGLPQTKKCPRIYLETFLPPRKTLILLFLLLSICS